ncbi:MAG TPA: erythromycin esterase family protein [Stenotrophomonas sp.]|nr:erythromycin esterase family protein [Stenotrophomonas sp.]
MAAIDPLPLLTDALEPLPCLDDAAFAAAFDRFADCRVVLLGESTHGTREFYRARAAITRRLVERHDFDFIAVEADWPDAASLHRYAQGQQAEPVADGAFERFPQWMWRNTEVQALAEWMRAHNAARTGGRGLGFYGLDLYSLGRSMRAVLAYLDQVDPQAAAIARQRYGCLSPWQSAPADYGQAVLESAYGKCEHAVVQQCRDLLAQQLAYVQGGPGQGEAFLDAAQNARLVAAAERYYRTMYYGGAESWNLRDTHMFDTLMALLEAHGPQSRGVVWAHNSHIGDARATEMGWASGELNIGQLCRQQLGKAAALVGFGTHDGFVAAASRWDGPMEVKAVRPSRPGSVEHLCHATGVPQFLLDLRDRAPEALRQALSEERLQRFIGVLYLAHSELHSHYAQVRLAGQFDAYVWFDHTGAVAADVAGAPAAGGMPDTFPSGL